MHFRSRLWLPLLLIASGVQLAGCTKPIPEEKAAYVGEWHGTAMALLITQDGSVAYRRLEGGVNKSIDGPLKAFEGDNFIVGVGPIATTFVVSVPPHQEGPTWKMTVDGVVLIRKSAEQESLSPARPAPPASAPASAPAPRA